MVVCNDWHSALVPMLIHADKAQNPGAGMARDGSSGRGLLGCWVVGLLRFSGGPEIRVYDVLSGLKLSKTGLQEHDMCIG